MLKECMETLLQDIFQALILLLRDIIAFIDYPDRTYLFIETYINNRYNSNDMVKKSFNMVNFRTITLF